MKRIVILIFIFVMLIGNVVFAEDVEFPEYPWYLPENNNMIEIHKYFIVKDGDGSIYMVYHVIYGSNSWDVEIELGEDENGHFIDMTAYGNKLYYYEFKKEEYEWELKFKEKRLKLYGYEILYSNYELVDKTTGEVFFPKPTLPEIMGESVEKIPAGMVGTMRTIFQAGFGILLGIGLARSLKVLYRYF